MRHGGSRQLFLSLLLLTWLARARCVPANATKAISKRASPSRPFWAPQGHLRFTSDLSRRAWKLLEQRNRPEAVAARRRHQEKLARARSAESAEPQMPPMTERAFEPPLLSTAAMLERLGPHNYDPDFSRIAMPHDAAEADARVEFGPHRAVSKAVRGVVRRFAHLLYDGGKGERLARRTRRNLRKFLAFFTACPVQFQWQDYGPRFWPRWLKKGECLHTGRSCSLPPGMTCRPHRFKAVTLLRYFCLSSWRLKDCGWKPMKLPVLHSCRCACPTPS